MKKNIKNFKEKWEEEYPEVVETIINIIMKKDSKQLKEFFKQENRYCFENCCEQWVDDYWADLKWLEKDATNILKTIDKK